MSPGSTTLAARSPGPWVFLALQLVLLAAFAGWAASRALAWHAARALPQPRPAPIELRPLYDDPAVVSDEQLARVLGRLVLRRHGPRTRIGQVDHMLRLWGPGVTYEDRRIFSGATMLRLLTDHRQFILVYGTEADPLLVDDGRGVRVRAFAGPASSTHIDHTLATLAEIGVGTDMPVVTPERRTTVSSLVTGSLASFSLNQSEVDWSALAYTLYLPHARRWISAEGQEVTFDRLAARLMREELTEGACSANHRLYGLVAMLRVDGLMADLGEPPLLEPATRQEVSEFLAGVTARLAEHQHALGFWNDDWPSAAPADASPSDRDGDRLSDRLIVTGHVLEWWALAPPELQPDRAVVVAAGQWLVRTIDALSDHDLEEHHLTFLTHAVRGLALWRGRVPSEEARSSLR